MTAGYQGILPGNAVSLKEEVKEEREAKEETVEREETKEREKARAKGKEKGIRGTVGIVGRRATNQQSVGM